MSPFLPIFFVAPYCLALSGFEHLTIRPTVPLQDAASNGGSLNLITLQTHDHLVPPHRGELVDVRVDPERAAELKAESRHFLSWDLTPRQVCDWELLLSGGFLLCAAS